MIRTENRIAQLIQKAKRTDSSAEMRLRGDALVVVVLPEREYEHLRAIRNAQKTLVTRPPKSRAEYLADTERALRRYEKKYKMTSAKFYRRFQAGELGETEDFFDWRVEYNAYRRMTGRANGKRQAA